MAVSMPQFVDICILAGCDYCDTIKGIAALTACRLVKAHGTLEKVIDSLDKEKQPAPEGVDFDEVRGLFQAPDVTDCDTIDLKWGMPDEAGILQFLVREKGFNEERILPGIKKLTKARGAGEQLRMDSFFQKVPNPNPSGGGGAAKRKAEESKDAKKKTKGEAASGKLSKKK